MDTTTHALSGYIMARAGLNESTGKWGSIAAVAAAIFPDLDLILAAFGPELAVEHHRSLTNSIFLVVPLSLFFAWLFVKISKINRYWSFFWVWLTVLLAHTFLDLATSYGTMILSPFWDTRLALDWLFIVDPYLVGVFLLPLIFSFFLGRKKMALARLSLGMAALYIGLCAWNHARALSLAEDFARERGLSVVRMAALPQPFSPFNWGNTIMTEDRIYRGTVSLLAENGRPRKGNPAGLLDRFRSPNRPAAQIRYEEIRRFDDSPWVKKAVRFEGAKRFFWFARFPVVRHRSLHDGKHQVEMFDLRFGSRAGRRPFRYVVEFDENGKVAFGGFLRSRDQKMGGDGSNSSGP
jgi:inner membrane protein